MYYLVQFEDGIYYICNKSRIVLKDNSVSVKYTGGGWYPATIIDCHEEKSLLVDTKAKIENCSKNGNTEPVVSTASCQNSGNENDNSEFVEPTPIKKVESVTTIMGTRGDTKLILTATCEKSGNVNVCVNSELVEATYENSMVGTKTVAPKIHSMELKNTESVVVYTTCENPDIENICQYSNFDANENTTLETESAAIEKEFIELRDTEPRVIATYEKPDIENLNESLEFFEAAASLNFNENQDIFPENVRNSVDKEGKFKRRKLWSTKEKHVTRTYFHSELENDGYINPNKIRELKNVHPEILQHRSIPMIKQWLEGEREKKKTRSDGIEATRLRYSTPEKELLEKSLEHHSLNGSEPSIDELENLIKENNTLKRRSADFLLSKFRYMQASKNI